MGYGETMACWANTFKNQHFSGVVRKWSGVSFACAGAQNKASGPEHTPPGRGASAPIAVVGCSYGASTLVVVVARCDAGSTSPVQPRLPHEQDLASLQRA